jgi:hypothetical protein
VIDRKRIRWAENVTFTREKRDAQRILIGKTEGKIPLGIPRVRWEYNIKYISWN